MVKSKELSDFQQVAEDKRTSQKIDEVTALREIFVTFFDTSNRNKASSEKEKLLVSMETCEQSMNPFHDFSTGYDENDGQDMYRSETNDMTMYQSSFSQSRFNSVLTRNPGYGSAASTGGEGNIEDNDLYKPDRVSQMRSTK